MPSISRGTPPGEDTVDNFVTDMMSADVWHVSQLKSTDCETLTTIGLTLTHLVYSLEFPGTYML